MLEVGRGGKVENEYQKTISRKLYADTPKAVLAALVVSLLTKHSGTAFEDVDARLIAEWDTLHVNGIIPQSAPRR